MLKVKYVGPGAKYYSSHQANRENQCENEIKQKHITMNYGTKKTASLFTQLFLFPVD